MDNVLTGGVVVITLGGIGWIIGLLRAARREEVQRRLRGYCNHESIT